jgi:hypothetical protein
LRVVPAGTNQPSAVGINQFSFPHSDSSSVSLSLFLLFPHYAQSIILVALIYSVLSFRVLVAQYFFNLSLSLSYFLSQPSGSLIILSLSV